MRRVCILDVNTGSFIGVFLGAAAADADAYGFADGCVVRWWVLLEGSADGVGSSACILIGGVYVHPLVILGIE